jgi:glycosyltransferase involved in cell wall biosynthesis
MSRISLASIIINNYNYGIFLKESIDSALNQNYAETEVIVVDDGSTDDSRRIIASYGNQIVPVLKENGGQASAFNAGFAVSRGEVIIFLDSDDALLPTAVDWAVQLFEKSQPTKVHWPLWVIDEHSKKTGRTWPDGNLPEGDLRETVIRYGPSSSYSPPTSGNAWARSFLAKVLPVPDDYKLCADDYLYALAPAFGLIKRISEPQGFYRVHGKNNYLFKSFDEKLSIGYRIQDDQCSVLERYFRDNNIKVDTEGWKRNLWFHRLDRAVRRIITVIPKGDTFILVDGDQWGSSEFVKGRRRFHFLERDGNYWGPPADDAIAIYELERLRQAGAKFLAFAWPAFWWLDFYCAFHQHLRSKFQCIAEDEHLILFDLCR